MTSIEFDLESSSPSTDSSSPVSAENGRISDTIRGMIESLAQDNECETTENAPGATGVAIGVVDQVKVDALDQSTRVGAQSTPDESTLV
jgi:hypothetical protein